MTTPTHPSTWNWLADTYWCVPPASLPALRFDDGDDTLTWRVDQTVWHITGYREGYFWGVSATLLRDAGEAAAERGPGSQPVGFTMVGSITPEGRVYITFIPDSRGSNTIGIGRAVPNDSEWSLEMQMSTGSSSQTTSHWATMVRVRPDDPYWDSLPGFGVSVSEMLEGLEPPEVAAPS
jgi:hypothetical protein